MLDPELAVAGDVDVLAQTRAHGEPIPARVCRDGADRAIVTFVNPQARVAAGQVVALYAGDVLLGGGIASNRS